ncbi:FAD-dependent oxidoreductase [Marisediminicola sp. LYQ134]|uniref:FAD-dependent oxidoreductase n=1 Tax=Marisediminicola sp. LYQ134 TaxID=3391061 RepID=UPI0039839E13
MTPKQHQTELRVIVAGGGLGGLALAAGLRTRGINVSVFERDTDLAQTGGYHIHLDEAATGALRDLLDPEPFEEVLASSATTRLQGGDIMRDMRGRLLYRSAAADDDGGVNIDRITLRLILADAVGDALHQGATVQDFARNDDGTNTVTLADGSTHDCDLLVGAEGVHSQIARSLAGRPTSKPTGLLGICGRTTVADLPGTAQRLFGQDSGLAIGPDGTGLYIGYHDPANQAAVRSPARARSVTLEPIYIWGAVLSESAATERLRPLTGSALRDATAALLQDAGWTSPMLDVIAESETDGIAPFRFHAGPPYANQLAPWPAGTVTALGDAVHAMPPTAGMGAATAIRDAADLATRLEAARDQQATIPAAVHRFEHGMRIRGAAAITASLGPVRMIHASATPIGRVAARLGLPIGAALARLRQRTR